MIYVRHTDLSNLLNTTDSSFNEFAYLLKDNESLIKTKKTMEVKTDNLVRTYREIAPEFDLIEEASAVSKQVITVIVMLALLFGIINTMLMAVLERTKEIGMLRAIGMYKRKIFLMIVLETPMISLVSAPVGLIAGFLTNVYFEKDGGDGFISICRCLGAIWRRCHFLSRDRTIHLFLFDVGRCNDRVDGCDLSCDQSG